MRAPGTIGRCVAWLAAGCTCGGPPGAEVCEDPSLWYALDGSAAVYWGCTPPEGWTNHPPAGTGDTAAAIRSARTAWEARELKVTVAPVRPDDGGAPPGATGGTGSTGATGDTAFGPRETAAPAADTGVVEDTGVAPDTGVVVDTGAIDTAAGRADTALPDGQDTSPAPADTDAPVPQGPVDEEPQ